MDSRALAEAHGAALQYLIWALEEIEKLGPTEARRHVRNALNDLERFRNQETVSTSDFSSR
jgi:hypothetical protein